jgi:integrating conjugative element protein (TIGR03749 family)
MQKTILQISLAAILFLIVTAINVSQAKTDVKVFNTRPIQISLEVGREHLIHFDDNIQYGLSNTMLANVSATAAAGVIYITPTAEFAKERMKVKLVSTGQIIFIDVQAIYVQGEALADEIRIVNGEQQAAVDEASVKEANAASTSITLRELVQYAAQTFYAPDRLKPSNSAITENVIKRRLFLDNLFMGSSAGLFELKPLMEFRTSRYVLTAISLKNKTLEAQKIKFSDVYPDFRVSAQHMTVGPAHSNTDTTVLYLISDFSLLDSGEYSL